MKKENIKLPPIGLTFSRSEMPQLGAREDFLAQLQKHKVKFQHDTVKPETLRSSQGEFNKEKIHAIIDGIAKPKSAVVVSQDNFVVDGHHRWAADYNMNKKTDVIRVKLPILELIRLAKTFPKTTYKDINQIKTTIKNVVKKAIDKEKHK